MRNLPNSDIYSLFFNIIYFDWSFFFITFANTIWYEDRNYTVLVTTSLMHVAEAGKVLSTVLPLAAALIFAFSMSAAWLFSECHK